MEKVITIIMTLFDWMYIPKITITDVVEIIIISYLIYHIILWFKTTRAWSLFKGILVLFVFVGIAATLQLHTILWLFKNTISVGIIAIIILFQPELRRALEELGRKKLSDVLNFDDKQQDKRLSDKTIFELVKTANELSRARTGALIVVEKAVGLGEYESSGIAVDALVSEQLLVNIFEHNTPLHDGAVIIRNNRVIAATCYLPLTDRKDVSKQLGTRHRAGIGISEVSDSLTIIVSEETGAVSVAFDGTLYRNMDSDSLRKHLAALQDNKLEIRGLKKLWKGGKKNEKK